MAVAAGNVVSAEGTAAFLKEHGVRATVYHAGLEASVRNEAQEDFRDRQ